VLRLLLTATCRDCAPTRSPKPWASAAPPCADACAATTRATSSSSTARASIRCEAQLRQRWLPGKCLAEELGYLEINSFYRAFRRWTGVSYSEYKQRREQPGCDRAAGGETAGALPPGAAAGNAAASRRPRYTLPGAASVEGMVQDDRFAAIGPGGNDVDRRADHGSIRAM
jgi:hypothetical protein